MHCFENTSGKFQMDDQIIRFDTSNKNNDKSQQITLKSICIFVKYEIYN
jgi:hypothetical protein